jgi:tetratricopeptide (TPR) repeat protein
MHMDPIRYRPQPAWPVLLAFAACFWGALLGGCASAPPLIYDREHLISTLRARNVDPGNVILPYGLNDAMRRFAHETASTSVPPIARLEKLRERLINELQVRYAWGYTGTALEVFEKREANCLAYTNLFVGMARELGVPVTFLAVDSIERYRKEGDLVVVSDHVAVGYGDSAGSLLIFDFADQEPVTDQRLVRRISDLTAIAMFYSNRGAEALRLGLTDAAVTWLQGAIAVEPGLANAWVNLGVALRRQGDVAGAEKAYKKALEIDPRVYSAYHNLATVLRAGGRDAEAAGFEAELERTPNNNPFTFLSLGDLSLRHGRLEEAERFYRRAVSLNRDSAEVYAALGQLAAANGDLRLARRMLRKAEEIDAAMPRVARLNGLLATLEAPSRNPSSQH